MSSAVQPLRSVGRWPRICSHLKVGKSPRKWPGAVCVPSGRWRLWNQGPSASMSSASEGFTAFEVLAMSVPERQQIACQSDGQGRALDLEMRVLDDGEDVAEGVEHRRHLDPLPHLADGGMLAT